MTIQDAYQRLQAHLADGNLTLSRASLPVPNIETLFEATFGTAVLTFSHVNTIGLTGGKITFSGKTTFHHIEKLAATATVEAIAGQMQFTFVSDLLSNWPFSPADPALPPHSNHPAQLLDGDLLAAFYKQVEKEEPRLFFTSYDHHDDHLHCDVTAGLNLVWLDRPDTGPTNDSFCVPLRYEAGQLRCTVALPYSLAMGQMHVEAIQMRVVSNVGAGAAGSVSAVGLAGTLKAGQLALAVAGRIEPSDLDVELIGRFDNLPVDGLPALESLTGLDDFGRLLPAALDTPAQIELTTLQLQFNPVQLYLKSVTLGFKLNQQWELLPDLLAMTGIAFHGQVQHPFEPGLLDVQGSLTGHMTLAGKNIIVEARLPNFAVSGQLEPGQTLPLAALLDEFAPGLEGVPQLDVSRLQVMAAPLDSFCSIGAAIESDWTLELDFAHLTLTRLSCDLAWSAGSVDGNIRGVMAFAGTDFLMQATLPHFEMSGALYQDPSLRLADVLETLLPGPAALPAVFPALEIIHPQFHVAPQTGAFALKGRCADILALSLGAAALEIEEIAVDVARRVAAGGEMITTASTAGRSLIVEQRFAVSIDKYGDADAWRLSGQSEGDVLLDFGAVVAYFLPDEVDLPPGIIALGVEQAAISYDFGTEVFEFRAETAGIVQFAALGSVQGTEVSLKVKPAAADSDTYHWQVTVAGAITMPAGLELAGWLECFDDERGAGIQFVPETITPLLLPLPLPPYRGEAVALALEFGPIAIAGADDAMTFRAELAVNFNNIPPFFDSVIADRIAAVFAADQDSLRITLDRLFEGIEFVLPPIPVSETQQVELGAARLDLTDLEFILADEVEASAKFGVGLPSQLNNLFGTQSNGRPTVEIFNSYDPARPVETLVNSHFAAGTAGVSFTILDSPFKCITLVTENGATWCDCDFGEYGAVRFMVPLFSLETASSSFRAAGGMEVIRPLKLPLGLLKNFLAANDQPDVAALLPPAIELKSVQLLDENDNLNITELVRHLESAAGDAFTLPAEVVTALTAIENQVNRLPDRLKQYLNISIPDAFAFDIAVTPDGGVTIDIAVEGDPVRLLFAQPSSPLLMGLELRGFSFGELLSGQLFLLKADFTFDYFDPYSLAAAFLPQETSRFLPDSRTLYESIIIRNLTMFIFYQTQVPIPIPLFFDELGMESKGIHGFEIQSHVRFPQPRLDPLEIITLLGEMFRFFSDENYLLDPNLPLDNIDPVFTLGANFIALPKYLGSELLGQKSDLATLSTYQLMAHLLNGLKTFSLNRLIKAMPIEYRIGSQVVTFFGCTSQITWLLTTPQEFVQDAYRQLRLTPAGRSKLLDILPTTAAGDEEGLALFLRGAGQIANGVELRTFFAIFGSGKQGAATGFEITGDIAQQLLHLELSGIVNVDARRDSPLVIAGRSKLTWLGSTILEGEIGYDESGLRLAGAINMFPQNPLLQLSGRVSGRLNRSAFTLTGDVTCSAGAYFVISGARLTISHEKISVSGSYLGQRVTLALQKTRWGVRLSAGLSPLGMADDFQITGPSSRRGPLLTLDTEMARPPKVTLSGSVALLGMRSDTIISVTPTGYRFELSGQLFRAHAARMTVETSTGLLQPHTFSVEAVMQPAFLATLSDGLSRQLKAAADRAVESVEQAQAQVNRLARELDGVIRQIDHETRRIEQQLRSQEQAAEQAVAQARSKVNQAKGHLNNVRAQVDDEKNRALTALNQAQKKVDDLNDDISRINRRIRSLKRSLEATPLYDVVKRGQLSTEIGLKEGQKAGLIVARNTATQVLEGAEAAVEQATLAANQATQAAQSQLSAANAGLRQATRQLGAIRSALNNISNQAQLQALNQLKQSKAGALHAANQLLEQVKQAQKGMLAVADFAARRGVAGLVTVESAQFSGRLPVVRGGRVTLVGRYRLMGQAGRTLSYRFDFNNMSHSTAAIAAQLQKLIEAGAS